MDTSISLRQKMTSAPSRGSTVQPPRDDKQRVRSSQSPSPTTGEPAPQCCTTFIEARWDLCRPDSLYPSGAICQGSTWDPPVEQQDNRAQLYLDDQQGVCLHEEKTTFHVGCGGYRSKACEQQTSHACQRQGSPNERGLHFQSGRVAQRLRLTSPCSCPRNRSAQGVAVAVGESKGPTESSIAGEDSFRPSLAQRQVILRGAILAGGGSA